MAVSRMFDRPVGGPLYRALLVIGLGTSGSLPALAADSSAMQCAVADSTVVTSPPSGSTRSGAQIRRTLAGAALADFGLAMLHRADGGGDPNRALSPLSLASGIGMVHAGTTGDARRELNSLLASRSASPLAFQSMAHTALAALEAASGRESPLRFANRIWLDRRAAKAPSPGYLASLGKYYGADAEIVDFAAGDDTRTQVNGWVARSTGGRIGALIPEGTMPASTRMLVTSALHFRSAWASPFDPQQTEERPFSLADGTTVQVPTMRAQVRAFKATFAHFAVFELPFASAYRLQLVVPTELQPPQALIEQLSGEGIAAWEPHLTPTTCALSLPRFRVDAISRPQKEVLRGLGVETVFTDRADFSTMLGSTGGRAHLGEVFHAAGISVDEAGAEASAATSANVQAKSIVIETEPTTVPCVIDRPFVFVLLHESGIPVLIGQVTDPTTP